MKRTEKTALTKRDMNEAIFDLENLFDYLKEKCPEVEGNLTRAMDLIRHCFLYVKIGLPRKEVPKE